jgi:hypothetical protein
LFRWKFYEFFRMVVILSVLVGGVLRMFVCAHDSRIAGTADNIRPETLSCWGLFSPLDVPGIK